MTHRLNRFTVTIMGAGKGNEQHLQINAGQRDRALATAEKWHGKGYDVVARDNMTGEIVYAEISEAVNA